MSDERFTFDFNRVTYREILDMDLDDEEQASDDTLSIIAQCLADWPFEAEPSVESIKDLGLEDFADLQTSFTAGLDRVFKRGE